MKKKILYTATSDIHIKTFHFPYLKMLKEMEYEVHLAIEKRGEVDLSFLDRVIYLPFKRSPLAIKNYSAFIALKKLISIEKYDLIHCHTPSVSVLTRLAARNARKTGTKVLYTAHGYHFYKGAPFKLWLFYFPIEKILSRITDGIILINREDYLLTKNKFWCKYSFRINGIGIDTNRLSGIDEKKLQETKFDLKINTTDFVLLYIAEFIHRKNHEFLIRAMPKLIKEVPNVKLFFAGKGLLFEKMKDLATELGLSQQIQFLGWRDDIAYLASLAHLGVSSSRQEGLGLGLAEEMLFKLPIVATDDRGHREIVVQDINGYLFEQGNADQFISYVKELSQDETKRRQFGEAAYQKAQVFSIDNSLKRMAEIYNQFLRN